MQGILIAIEGTDGSGKKTQADLLIGHLQKEGYKVSSCSFPQYGKKSAGPAEEYLNGAYGMSVDAVNPYAASLLFAVDRFDESFEIRRKLRAGEIVVLDRYVDSNGGHQGGRIPDPEERKKFLVWLYDIEYQIFGIPKPDINIFLHMPAGVGQKLVDEKEARAYIGGKKRDILEADLDHLKKAEESFLWLAHTYPENHIVIECAENGAPLSREVVHEKIWEAASLTLPKKAG